MDWFKNLTDDLRADGCTWRNVLPRILLAPRTQALVLMRLAQIRPNTLGLVFRRINYTRNGCDIAPRARIGGGVFFPHPLGVVIGPDVVIGSSCVIRQHASLGAGATGAPTLGDNVIVGIGATIFGGVTLGDRSEVAAHSVLRADVPAGMFAAGAPATVKGPSQAARAAAITG